MALINCPECKKEISDQAESCPSCGFPVQENIIKQNEHTPKGINYFDKEQKDELSNDMLQELSIIHSGGSFIVLSGVAFMLALGEIKSIESLVVSISLFAYGLPYVYFHSRAKNGMIIKKLTMSKGIRYNYITKIFSMAMVGLFFLGYILALR